MDDIKFDCPACSQSLKAPPYMLGKKIICPFCERIITIPAYTNIPCKKCGAMILLATAEINGGLCMSCAGYTQSIPTSASTRENAVKNIVTLFGACFWIFFSLYKISDCSSSSSTTTKSSAEENTYYTMGYEDAHYYVNHHSSYGSYNEDDALSILSRKRRDENRRFDVDEYIQGFRAGWRE